MRISDWSSDVCSSDLYLTKILAHEAFASGDFNTGFVVRHFPQQRIANETHSFRQIALAAIALYLDDARALVDAHELLPEFVGWASSHDTPVICRLKSREQEHVLALRIDAGCRFAISEGDHKIEIGITRNVAGEFHYLCDGVQQRARCARDGNQIGRAHV